MIRKTNKDDIPRVMDIINGAKKSIATLNIDQWQTGYPTAENIESDIEKGIGYVLIKDGIVVGTVAIDFNEDPSYKEIFEGEWAVPGSNYVGIHRIAVDNAGKKRGYASEFIEYAAAIAKQGGADSLRVDTHAGNIPMRKMLEKNSFRYCGIIYLADGVEKGNERVAYERKL